MLCHAVSIRNAILLLIIVPVILVSCKYSRQKNYRIGILTPGKTYNEVIEGLKVEIEKSELAGRINLVIDDSPKTYDEFKKAAIEMNKQPIDLVYPISTPAVKAVQSEIKDKPIVFNAVGDPIGANIVKSYASPGKNISGCTNLSKDFSGKRLELFVKIFPKIKKIATFYNPKNQFSLLAIGDVRNAARLLKVNIVEHVASDVAELRTIIQSSKKGDFDGIYLIPDSMVLSISDEIIRKAKILGVPSCAHEEQFVYKGATMSYGADFFELGKLSFQIVKAFLTEDNAGAVPVFLPSKIEFVINHKEAKEMGYEIPIDMLFYADKVIN
jgi:putative ABC transport system substrate-binding protein